ncbi:MAG TPA: prephenate dehydrogenase [Pseudolysinimonas sp.]|nr:prephenate dehydrogenase [Pseudolysinimonas sp.]
MTASRLRSVRIVGAGLLGASVGLALREAGVDTVLDDTNSTAVDLAVTYGAGRPSDAGDTPELIVVAVPPASVAAVVIDELARYPHAIVTDVASVKTGILQQIRAAGGDLQRYVGSHPMAGRERGGAMSARADLFEGRPWVITSDEQTAPDAIALVRDLAVALGATSVQLTAEEHDRSVAIVSHAPQIVASLLAARLGDAPTASIALAGQGLRDTTRIAASDAELWVQILEANAAPVAEVLRAYRDDLDAVIASLDAPGRPGATADTDADASRGIAAALAAGNAGVARIPGKHGTARRFQQLIIKVDDTPGELARLLSEIGDEGVNIEDLRLEHSPGAAVGFVEVSVLPEVAHGLATALVRRGWGLAEEDQ